MALPFQGKHHEPACRGALNAAFVDLEMTTGQQLLSDEHCNPG